MNAARDLSLHLQKKHNPYANKTFEFLLKTYPVFPIHSKEQHDHFKEIFLGLIRKKKEIELSSEELSGIDNYIGMLKLVISDYESKKYEFEKAAPAEILNDLKEMNNLTQNELADLLGVQQPQVSRILRGERRLTAEQIARLSKRFNVSPSLFFSK
jgi:HTH-type transcriptional regulator/antitoxin HigA